MDLSSLSIDKITKIINSEEPTEELIAAMKNDKRRGVQRLLEKYIKAKNAALRRKQKSEEMISFEKELWDNGYELIGGIDEAGRGPLAGPVVAACLVLPKGLIIEGIDDSKKLTPAKRDALFEIIQDKAVSVGVGIVDNDKIDEINIYNATKEAMQQAAALCIQQPEYLLIDAMQLDDVHIPQLSIISGDAKSQSIAAASIIAKVTRDRIMDKLSDVYPGYGFEKHKGYGTEEHIAAIIRLGLSPVHRRSFTGKFT